MAEDNSGVETLPDYEALRQHYTDLWNACAEAQRLTFEPRSALRHAAAHAYLSDFEKWLEVLADRREVTLLDTAAREYQHALFAATTAQYRAAFASLRLFLELALGAVRFSTDEMSLREWLQGRRDNSWKHAIRVGRGIFKERFARAFYPDLLPEVSLYDGIAVASYRECSEYIHGNAGRRLPPQLAFDATVLDMWHSTAERVTLVVSFALVLRYLNDLGEVERSKIEHGVLDQLGHLAGVRGRFGGVTE